MASIHEVQNQEALRKALGVPEVTAQQVVDSLLSDAGVD